MGADAEDQREIDLAMIELDGTENKSRLGANAILGRQPGRGQGGGRCARDAAVQLCRRGFGACPAGADDEHHQWRRTCRQPDRFPGIHDHAGRRAVSFAEAVRWGSRNLPHPEEGPGTEKGLATAVGDEGGFAPNLAEHPRRARFRRSPRSKRPGSSRATTSRWRSIAPRPSSSRRRQIRDQRRGPVARAGVEFADYLAAS